MSCLNDGYPKQIRIDEYDAKSHKMVSKLCKVYSSGDEAMVRRWYEDMNRKLQSQQRRDDCAAKA
jgi:hypothetical protein